jgi:hypothetical protein
MNNLRHSENLECVFNAIQASTCEEGNKSSRRHIFLNMLSIIYVPFLGMKSSQWRGQGIGPTLLKIRGLHSRLARCGR